MLHLPRPQQLRALLLVGAVLALGACSTANGPDPWRGTNEKIFRMNNYIDKVLLEPAARGYDAATPGMLQLMVGNFFDTLKVPRTFVNDVLQGKPLAATQDLGRLAANLIAGLVGLVDVASEMGIPKNEEDFGQTLGRWRAPPGPFVVLPVIGPPFNGPNTVRDIAAWPLDVATDPTIWVSAFGLGIVRTVDSRARYLEELGQLREDSIDYYVGVRDLYLQGRASDIRDGAPAPGADEEDLYELEEDEAEGAETDDAQP